MAAEFDFGDWRRLSPVDDAFGLGRGRPIDRHYIEAFLLQHASDVRGRVLEVGEDAYTRTFGGSRVARSDVLHVDAGHPGATLVADLREPASFPADAYDCFICTQTLTYVYELDAAVASMHRLLAPGGVLLVTVPGISQTSPLDQREFGEYWRFTAQSLARLLAARFGVDHVRAEARGNVLAATAFLQGLCVDDLTSVELEHRDPRYELVVAARAVKQPTTFDLVTGNR